MFSIVSGFGRGVVWVVSVTVLACGGYRASSLEEVCPPPGDRQLPAGARADALVGTYELTLVASDGRATTGLLRLNLTDDAHRVVPTPSGSPTPNAVMSLYGITNIALEEVGAIRMGDTELADPAMPGVAVLERHVLTNGDTTSTEITLRLGSEANRRDVTRFDSGFTALYVAAIDATRVGGTWASGVSGIQVRGHFCAERSD